MKTKTADKLPNMHSTEFRGIPVVIQWPKGSTRVGKHEDGTPYKTEMTADYGYIPDTVAAGDEERLDVYIGPNKNAENAYVIEQNKDNGEFDEYKVMLGYDSLEDAEESYYEHVDESKLGDISEVPFDYLFDRVMEERHDDKEQEIEETRTEIKKDEQKIADHDDKMSVIDAFVKLYKHECDYYEEVAHQVQETVEDALQEAGIRAIVTYRAKKPRALRKKLIKRDGKRHYQSFRDIYNDIVDLAGVRVALYLPDDQAPVQQIIETLFAPVREPKRFPRDAEPGENLGYVATHYLVQLRPENLHKEELRYADTNVEIQVASVLMHAWAEVTHDLIYKPEKGRLTEGELRTIKELNDIVKAGEAALTRLQQSVESRTDKDLRFELTSALTKLAGRLATQSKGRALKRITAADVTRVAEDLGAGLQAALNTYMKNLGWNHAGFNDWTAPTRPQDQVQTFHDGWIHRAWDKIEGTGDSLQELQAHLASVGLGEAQHPHRLPNQTPHVSYLRAKIALWNAHRKADDLDDKLREAYEKAQYKKPELPGDESAYIQEALKKLHPRVTDVRELSNDQYHKVLGLAQDIKTQSRTDIPDLRQDEVDPFNPQP